jgi:prepilin-type N-terminal cleavage/methylation domain-containing protein
MTPRQRQRRGFTLIELLSSIAIGLALSVIATSTFFQVLAIMRRTQARLEMHNTARFVFQALRQDLMALEQEGACYIETRADSQPSLPPNDPRHDGEVCLTFLRGKVDNYGYSYDGEGTGLNTDLVWTQWKWDQKLRAICSGSNSRVRSWDNGGTWVSPAGYEYGGFKGSPHSFMIVPEPRRAAGADAKTRLDDNAFGSGHSSDIGDYTDLARRVLPTTRNVTNFALEVVLNDGSTVRADGTATAKKSFDGVFVDGRLPTAVGAGPPPSLPHLRRPRLIRIRFDLTDVEAKLSQSFSFSFQAPAPLPKL